jgi:lysozyme
MTQIKVVDVSHHQPAPIDWPKVKAFGIGAAIIKATEGINYIDPCFTAHASGAIAAGLHIGAYHFLRAGDVKEQARQCIAAIKPYKIEYPIVCDLERDDLIPLGKTKLTDMVIEFCEAVRAAGYYPMLYTNLNWARNYLDMSRLKKYDLWFARYNSTPGYDGISMWQFSSIGSVPGITGSVDMDISYKDYPSIINAPKLCDTTTDVNLTLGQAYTFKVTSAETPSVTVGTSGAVALLPRYNSGNDRYFYLVGIGKAESATGVYVNGVKQFVAHIK